MAEIAQRGATFKSLGDPWCDTTRPHGRLTVLGGLAEFERHLILARTDEGRRRAQQRGVKFGRKQRRSSSTCSRVRPWSRLRAAMRSATQRFQGCTPGNQ
ncbi:MAG: recombinase family protein [Xanthobacteraceae bacterium]